MKNTLEADSIILEFDTNRVLSDIYIKCETDRIIGLLGRNGSGKTCLMNIIYGELALNNKSIRINGKAVYDIYKYPDIIKYLPQFNFLPKSLSLKRIFKDFNLDFSDFVSLFPEFSDYYKLSLEKLSGGQRRIVEIYSILVSKSQFCLLDEPFSQIMPIHVESIIEIIQREKTTKGILITDHLYRHIIDICDDLYVISNGKTYLTSKLEDLEALGYVRI